MELYFTALALHMEVATHLSRVLDGGLGEEQERQFAINVQSFYKRVCFLFL